MNFFQQFLGMFDVFQEMPQGDDVKLFTMGQRLGGNIKNRETVAFLADLAIRRRRFKPDDLEAVLLPYMGDPPVAAADVEEFVFVPNDKFIDQGDFPLDNQFFLEETHKGTAGHVVPAQIHFPRVDI